MRRASVDPIGLSFIDLVSCAFCAVLVLFLIQEDRAAPPFSDDPVDTENVGESVRLTWDPSSSSSKPQLIVKVADQEFRSWKNNNVYITWSRAPGKLIGVVNRPIGGDIKYLIINKLTHINEFEDVFEFRFYPAGLPGSQTVTITGNDIYRVTI